MLTRQPSHAKLSRRDRRKLERAAEAARAEFHAARQTWQVVGAAAEAELVTELETITSRIDTLDQTRRLPDAGHDAINRRLAALDEQIAVLELQAGVSTKSPAPSREGPDLALGL